MVAASHPAERPPAPEPRAPGADESTPHWLAALVLTAAGYALAAGLALLLAIPPGYASPLYPAAGVALASVLIFGPRMLPAVALGAFAVNLSIGLQHAPFDATAVVLPMAVATGATLQAWVGAALIGRLVRQPLTLAEPRDIAMFLFACAASCLTSATLGNLTLWLAGTVPAVELPLSLAIWWVGDLLGVLIGTPVVLTLFGRPRDAWLPRRFSVGLALALVTSLLALGIRQVAQSHRERAQTAFDHAAASAAQALVTQLREPLQALEALNGVFVASELVTRDEMGRATRAWLASGRLQAMGWVARVAADDIAAFEATARAEGVPRYTVFDRPGAGPATGGRSEAMAIRLIEPRGENAAALGVNVRSVPAARTALEATSRTGRPAATEGFELTQPTAGTHRNEVVIYQAVYAPSSPSEAQRAEALRGAVFVTLRAEDQLGTLAAQVPDDLAVCLVDIHPGAAPRRLAGADGCEAPRPGLRHVHAFSYAGREWQVQVTRAPGREAAGYGADVWWFALVGLASTAMLGGFLLALTGRTRRVETAVRERTAALRAEVRERQGVEAALRDSEQRIRNILDNVPIGVIYTDLVGEIRQANPRFCELTGIREAELLGLNVADCTHPDDVARDVELRAQLVRGELPSYRRQKRYLTRVGAIVSAQVTVSVLRDAKGQPSSIVAVVEDIGEQLKLEEAERAREAAEASNRAKSEFLSRMSHELRTPLNAMLGFAQLLELDPAHPLAPAQQPRVTQIQDAGWHLLEMINDVLDLSRIESGNLSLQLQAVNLRELLDPSIAMLSGEAARRRIEITQAIGIGTGTVLGDATRIKQILTNLLSNAVKYNADGGRVHIETRLEGGDTVELTVTDTGLGMTPEQLGGLFQPFNRLGRERSSQEGTGIGLVISQRLADSMGGSLRAASRAGEGSMFTLTLPCPAEIDTVRSEFDELAREPAAYHRRRVHYVEDNETNVEVMRGMLAQRPQVELEVSIDGREALAALVAPGTPGTPGTPLPDLILLDMHLPDISGMELLRRFRADPRLAGVPIVMVSADALEQQIDAAFEAGCNQYLTKPVNVSELLAVIDAILEPLDTDYL